MFVICRMKSPFCVRGALMTIDKKYTVVNLIYSYVYDETDEEAGGGRCQASASFIATEVLSVSGLVV